MMKIIVAGDGHKETVRRALDELLPWIRSRAEVIAVEMGRDSDLSQTDADLILAFGGDGFLLGIARRLDGRKTPVACVNFGKLGFLARYDLRDAIGSLGEVLEGRMRISRRNMLEIDFEMAGHPLFALNDAVISRGRNPSIIRIDMNLDTGEHLSYSGDGLIVSTPTGSTAYSLSAGGPIMMPGVSGLLLTPICPQAFGARPLVVPADARIVIESFPGPEGAVLTVDGRDATMLSAGDSLRVGMCDREFLLVSDPKRRFTSILKDKLNWGELNLKDGRKCEEGA